VSKRFRLGALLLIVCLGVTLAVSGYAGPRFGHGYAKRAIADYLTEHNIDLAPGTPEYDGFLKDILWGVHSEFRLDPRFHEIATYCADYLNRDAAPARLLPTYSGPAPLWTYNAAAAVNYAYAWAEDGGTKRNPNYPDFGANDCTNFASQCTQAGGVPEEGSGSCGSEGTTSEWYVQSSAWWCLTSSWAWSSSWSVVMDYWTYHTQFKGHASSTTYTFNQLAQLRTAAAPGDYLQLQDAAGGAKWHTMIVTKKVGGEIYLTYHAGPNGLDVVDNALGNFASPDYNYWLIEF